MAKRGARVARAKGAHDELVSTAYRLQADALAIEARAKVRLADEYDAAQARGEVAKRGGERSGQEHSPPPPPAADLGLTRKQIHEARMTRDIEAADPGVTQRTAADLARDGRQKQGHQGTGDMANVDLGPTCVDEFPIRCGSGPR